MSTVIQKRARLLRRRRSIRRKVQGTPNKPRLCVSRSLKHIGAQIVDDLAGRTLVAASTRGKDVKNGLQSTGNQEAAAKVGTLLAERAAKAGIVEVCFDRGGRKYHGRVKALADAARKGGLKF